MEIKKLNWKGILPLACAGYVAGIIATLLPLTETVFLSIGIGALTGSLMRYAQPRDTSRD